MSRRPQPPAVDLYSASTTSKLPSQPPSNLPIVPGLFPRQSINMLIGAIDAGKTKLWLSQLNHYVERRGFLAYGLGPEPLSVTPPDAHALLEPEQVGVIACTKYLRYWQEQVAPYPSLRNPLNCPLKVLGREMSMETFREAYSELSAMAARPVKFLILEGIQHLIGKEKYSEPYPVRDLCILLQEFCEQADVTILGTVGISKQNMLTNYPKIGDKIYGGITWGQETHNHICIEEISEDTNRRKIHIRCRDAARRRVYADFSMAGVLDLIEFDESIPVEATAEQKLSELLKEAAAGDSLTWEVFYAWGERLGVSDRTVRRWAKARTKPKGTELEKVGNSRPAKFHKAMIQ